MPPSRSSSTFRDLLRYPWVMVAGLVATLAGLVAKGFLAGLEISALEAMLVSAFAGAVAGALSTSSRMRGAIVGLVGSVGIVLGIIGYTEARYRLFPSETFWAFEFVIGMLVGVVPGIVLWKRWFRDAYDGFQNRPR